MNLIFSSKPPKESVLEQNRYEVGSPEWYQFESALNRQVQREFIWMAIKVVKLLVAVLIAITVQLTGLDLPTVIEAFSGL